MVSDTLRLPVRPLKNPAVSIYLPGATGPTTNHDLAEQVNYVLAPGNHAAETGGQAFTGQAYSWFYLSGVDVRPLPADAGAVIALGEARKRLTGFHESVIASELRLVAGQMMIRRSGRLHGAPQRRTRRPPGSLVLVMSWAQPAG